MADTVSRRQSRGPPDVKSRSTRPPEVSEGCGGKTAHPVPPCTRSPSSSGIALPSSPTVPHHIGRVGCKGFPVNLSTNKSLGIDQARMSSSGFPFYVPPQHLHPGLLPSQVHTQGHLIYHLPTTGNHFQGCLGSTPRQDLLQARRIFQLGRHNPHPPRTQVTHATLSP